MKIGLRGGSFDPVHHGHLLCAQDACEQMGLDRVLLVPAARAPLKDHPASAPGDDRMEMLRLATAGDGRMVPCDIELRRGGTSYTIDTVRALLRENPGDRHFLIIGADQAALLTRWHEIGELAKLAEFIGLERPGHPAPQPPGSVPGLRLHRIRPRALDISSSELRRRARGGQPLRHFLHPQVLEYIRSHNLYQTSPATDIPA